MDEVIRILQQMDVYEFIYSIVKVLVVADVSFIVGLYLVQLASVLDHRLLNHYQGSVNKLVDAVLAGGPDELLPAIRINYWSRRALLLVMCKKMQSISKIERAKLSVVLEKEGITDYLIAMLHSMWLAHRLKACYFLGQINCAKAIPHLKRMVSSQDYQLAEAALFALSKIGHNDEFSFVLENLLRDRRFSVERMADLVSGIMHHRPQRLLRLAMETKDLQMKVVAIAAVGRSKYEPALPILAQLLQHHDDEIRTNSALSLIGSNYQPAVGRLAERLKNDEVLTVKVACARALGSLQALDAVEELKDSLRHSNWLVRSAAAEALGSMGEKIIPIIQHQITIEADRFALDRLKEILSFFEIINVSGHDKHGRMA